MEKNNIDRRTQKTRESIHEALFTLMQEKPYNKINIQAIIDRANVGRSTFYLHFATKDELLSSIIEKTLDSLNQDVPSHIEHDKDNYRIIPIVELFEHIKENNKIMKGLVKANCVDLFLGELQAYWNNKIEEYLYSKQPIVKEHKVPLAVLSNHLSGTMINMLKWWIINKMTITPSEMDRYYQELTRPCINLLEN